MPAAPVPAALSAALAAPTTPAVVAAGAAGGSAAGTETPCSPQEEDSARAALHALEQRQGASQRAEAALLRALQEQVESTLATIDPPPPPLDSGVGYALAGLSEARLPEAAVEALAPELAALARGLATRLAALRDGLTAQRRQLREGYQAPYLLWIYLL